MFADDTNIYYESTSLNELERTVNKELDKLYLWLNVNRLSLNIDKTNFIIFHPYNKPVKQHVTIKINKKAINGRRGVGGGGGAIARKCLKREMNLPENPSSVQLRSCIKGDFSLNLCCGHTVAILNTDNKEASTKINNVIMYHWLRSPSIGAQPNRLTADRWVPEAGT